MNLVLKVFFVFLVLLLVTLCWANPLKLKQQDQEVAIAGIYREVVLEDFESLPFSAEDIRQSQNIQVRLSLAEDYPTPLPEVGKYLVIELESEGAEALQIFFRHPLVLRQHVRWFSLWVHSMKLPGDLLLIVEDNRGEVHALSFGKLSFRGWRQLIAPVPDKVVQQDHIPGQNEALKIVQLIYRPGPPQRLKKSQLFFIDKLSASMREKYLLKPPP